MSNATVMLFPSFGKPEFQMSIILKNGNVKSFKQTLNGPLEANSKLTLTLTLGDIFPKNHPENSPLTTGTRKARQSMSLHWIELAASRKDRTVRVHLIKRQREPESGALAQL